MTLRAQLTHVAVAVVAALAAAVHLLLGGLASLSFDALGPSSGERAASVVLLLSGTVLVTAVFVPMAQLGHRLAWLIGGGVVAQVFTLGGVWTLYRLPGSRTGEYTDSASEGALAALGGLALLPTTWVLLALAGGALIALRSGRRRAAGRR